MPVVSISLPDDLVADVDNAIEAGDFRGRSEFLRAALRAYLLDAARPSRQEREHTHGSITITYSHGREARISEVRHTFHDVVLSMMHTHCEAELCMDVLIVGGPAARIAQLTESLERMRDVERCRLVTIA